MIASMTATQRVRSAGLSLAKLESASTKNVRAMRSHSGLVARIVAMLGARAPGDCHNELWYWSNPSRLASLPCAWASAAQSEMTRTQRLTPAEYHSGPGGD